MHAACFLPRVILSLVFPNPSQARRRSFHMHAACFLPRVILSLVFPNPFHAPRRSSALYYVCLIGLQLPKHRCHTNTLATNSDLQDMPPLFPRVSCENDGNIFGSDSHLNQPFHSSTTDQTIINSCHVFRFIPFSQHDTPIVGLCRLA
jgi:hypothetical protein